MEAVTNYFWRRNLIDNSIFFINKMWLSNSYIPSNTVSKMQERPFANFGCSFLGDADTTFEWTKNLNLGPHALNGIYFFV